MNRIASLEASISRYEAAWDASTDAARKDKLLDVITESRKTLNILLAQQSKHIFYSYHLLAFLVWSCIYFLVDDLYKLLSNRVFSTNVFLLNNLQFTADILFPMRCLDAGEGSGFSSSSSSGASASSSAGKFECFGRCSLFGDPFLFILFSFFA